jgi:hypothetical protein
LIFNFHAVQSAVMGSNTAVEAKHTDSRGRATREDALGCHPPEPRSIFIHVADVDQALEACRSSPGLVNRSSQHRGALASSCARLQTDTGSASGMVRERGASGITPETTQRHWPCPNRVIAVMVGRMSPHPKRLPLGAGPATRLAGTRART